MKRSIIAAFIPMFVASCGTLTQYTVTSVTDYSPFIEHGVFVTESNSIQYDHRPLGSVVSITTSSASKGIDAESAFKEISSEVISKGGNGIINLNLEIIPGKEKKILTVTGMAVVITDPDAIQYINENIDRQERRSQFREEQQETEGKSNRKKRTDDIYYNGL